MKSMCRRRPTSAALAIAVAVAHRASCGVGAFVSPAPGAGIATLPPSFSSRLLASVEEATVTDTSSSSNAASAEEKQETTSTSENPRKEGLALMLDDGELFAYPDCVDFELLAAAASCSADEINRRRTMVEVPSEMMYHGNLVTHLPLKKQTRRNEKKRKRRELLRRLWSRIRAS